MDSTKSALASAESKTVGVFFVLLFSLFLIAKIHSYKVFSLIQKFDSEKRIAVNVQGAVAKPGVYWVWPGTKWEEILRKVKPKPQADFDAIQLEERVEAEASLFLPERKEITVYIQRENKEILELKVPVESRICDLKTKGDWAKEGNASFWRKKRRLKHKEILEIPSGDRLKEKKIVENATSLYDPTAY